MDVLIYPSKAIAIEALAEDIAREVKLNPKGNLGLPTGNTYTEVYRALKAHSPLDFKHIHTFNLDEYIGIPSDHPGSFKTYMTKHLFDWVNSPKTHRHFPPTEGDVSVYDAKMSFFGGLDVLYLGLGQNGHIAFNEPGTDFLSKTHQITLTEDTRQANQAAFTSLDDVPLEAVTMGISTIMGAKRLVLAAFGEEKAQAVKDMLYGPITKSLPASILNQHPCVTIVLDQEAARHVLEEEYGSKISSSSQSDRRRHRITRVQRSDSLRA